MITVLIVLCAPLAPLLFLAGLAIATAGRTRVLNSVDYQRVENPVALHRWVGRRLSVVGLGIGAIGAFGLFHPTWSLVLGALLTVWFLLGLGCCIAGISRFVRLR